MQEAQEWTHYQLWDGRIVACESGGDAVPACRRLSAKVIIVRANAAARPR